MIHQTLYIDRMKAIFTTETDIVNQQDEAKYIYKRFVIGSNYELMNHNRETIYTFIHKWGSSTPYDMYDKSERKLMRFTTSFWHAIMNEDYVQLSSEELEKFKVVGKPQRKLFKILKNEEILLEVSHSDDIRFKRKIDLYVEDEEVEFALGLMIGVIATCDSANTSMD